MIHFPKEIKTESWLNKSRFEWFRKGYDYALTQTQSIPALSETEPEKLYYAVCSILKANGIAIPDEKNTPDVSAQLADFIHNCRQSEQFSHSEWLISSIMEVYVRHAPRLIEGSMRVMLDVANVTVSEGHRGRGWFTKFLDDAEKTQPWGGIYVENIGEPRLFGFLEKRGYVHHPTVPNCMYKLKETGHGS